MGDEYLSRPFKTLQILPRAVYFRSNGYESIGGNFYLLGQIQKTTSLDGIV